MSKRIFYWDNLKYLLITFVVLGHFIDPLTDGNSYARRVFLFIYSFHVPLFVFISGVFYSSNNLKAKVLFYIYTGFAMKALNLLSNVLIRGMRPHFELLGDKAAPWYLFSLAAFMIIRYILRDINKWFGLGFALILGCYIGYDASIGDSFYLSRILVFFPFYMAGSMVDPDNFPKRIKEKWWYYLAALCVIVLLFYSCNYQIHRLYKYRHLLTGRNPFSESVLTYGFFARLGCYTVSTFVGLSVMILTPCMKLPLISVWGRSTLCVFFWHKFFYYLFERFTPMFWLFNYGVGGMVIYMIIAAALTALLSAIKWFSFPIKQIQKLCYWSADKNRSSFKTEFVDRNMKEMN